MRKMEQSISDTKSAILNKFVGRISMKSLTEINSFFLYATPNATNPVHIIKYLAISSVQGIDIKRMYLAKIPITTTIVIADRRITRVYLNARSNKSKNFFMQHLVSVHISSGAHINCFTGNEVVFQ